MTVKRDVLSVLALIFSSAACAQVMGVEDARVDPTLASAMGAAGGSATLAESGSQNQGGSVAGGPGHGGTTSQGGASSAGTSGGAAFAGTSQAGAPGEPSVCDSYCTAVMSNCVGAYEQYHTHQQCLAVCRQLPAGSTGDENVDTVECRVRQVNFAETEPAVYCKSAGPLGSGKCGSNCDSYCALMDVTCTASSTAGNTELSYFNSEPDCMSSCTALPADPGGPVQYSSSPTAVPSSYIGNNVFCRTYHVAAALEQDAPTEHCPHAMGGDPCNPQ